MKNNKLLFEKLTRWATNRIDEKKDSVDEASEPCCEACGGKHKNEEDILELDIEEVPNKGKAVEKTVDGKK